MGASASKTELSEQPTPLISQITVDRNLIQATLRQRRAEACEGRIFHTGSQQRMWEAFRLMGRAGLVKMVMGISRQAYGRESPPTYDDEPKFDQELMILRILCDMDDELLAKLILGTIPGMTILIVCRSCG